MMIGLEIDEPIEAVVDRLQRRGVRFNGSIVKDGPGSFASLDDPDGNAIYLWEVNREIIPETEFAGTGAARP
jgi:hypothetical protein